MPWLFFSLGSTSDGDARADHERHVRADAEGEQVLGREDRVRVLEHRHREPASGGHRQGPCSAVERMWHIQDSQGQILKPVEGLGRTGAQSRRRRRAASWTRPPGSVPSRSMPRTPPVFRVVGF